MENNGEEFTIENMDGYSDIAGVPYAGRAGSIRKAVAFRKGTPPRKANQKAMLIRKPLVQAGQGKGGPVIRKPLVQAGQGKGGPVIRKPLVQAGQGKGGPVIRKPLVQAGQGKGDPVIRKPLVRKDVAVRKAKTSIPVLEKANVVAPPAPPVVNSVLPPVVTPPLAPVEAPIATRQIESPVQRPRRSIPVRRSIGFTRKPVKRIRKQKDLLPLSAPVKSPGMKIMTENEILIQGKEDYSHISGKAKVSPLNFILGALAVSIIGIILLKNTK